MSVSQQSVLGSSQNLIASHVAGCNPPTLKNSIAIPAATTLFFPNVSGAVYTIAVLAAAATICLPLASVSKGYQMDFLFGGTETKVCTFTSLRSDGVVGTAAIATAASVISGHAIQTNAAGTGLVATAAAANQATFAVGTTVFPGAGDRVSFICDGVNWYVEAISFLNSATAVFQFNVAA